MVKRGSASAMINLLTTGYRARVSTAFGSLRSVAGASLLPVVDAGCIKRTAYDVILNARQVLYPSSADQNHGVFLKIMSLAGNICCYFAIVAQTNPADFSQG